MLANEGVGIEIRNVNLSYGANHILKDVSLSIEPGEFFAFLGPSGCGKTTLLRLIAGFNQADSGDVRLGGEDISRLPPWQRNVGMVFQSYALWPHMTVARNVAFGLEERRLGRNEIAEKVAAALALVGLDALADRYPSQLSGGQQQRVALARTIAIEPIFVTHDQEEANSVCDRIAVLNAGTVQQVGTPMELYQNPANLFVAGFLGTANILSGRITTNGAQSAFAINDSATLPLPAGLTAPKNANLVFRPQHATLRPIGMPGLAGTVVHREFLGASVRYGVTIAGSEILVEAPFASAGGLLEVGAPVAVAIDIDRAQLLGV
jgi:iron(III) transport system ATP-binding protein